MRLKSRFIIIYKNIAYNICKYLFISIKIETSTFKLV